MPLGLLTAPNEEKYYPVHLVARYFKVRKQIIKGSYRKKQHEGSTALSTTEILISGRDFGWIDDNLKAGRRPHFLVAFTSSGQGAGLVSKSSIATSEVVPEEEQTVMPENETETPSLRTVLAAFEHAIKNRDIPTIPAEESLKNWSETERKIEEAELRLKSLIPSRT